MSKLLAYHIFVYGRVQGVGFRYWTVSLARAFNVSGWVRNSENYHCVEIFAESKTQADLDEFIEAVKKEHPYAKVDATELSAVAPAHCKGFRVIR